MFDPCRRFPCCSVRLATVSLVWVLCVLPAGQGNAAFVLVEDFEGLVPGTIDGQNGWFAADPTSLVAADPIGGTNQVLEVSTASTRLHRPALVVEDTARMLFLRFRFGEQLNFSLGMSESSNPDQFGEFEPELSMTNSVAELRINDGGIYEVLALLEPDTWYSCWLLIDNAADQTQVWLHARGGDAADPGDQLDAEGQTLFDFRSGAASDLIRFFIKTGGGSGPDGPLYLDDLYLENTDALDLSNPSASPAALASSVHPASPGRLERARPNPFNPETTIAFGVETSAVATLVVHDAGGRRVRELWQGLASAGRHVTSWDGRNDAGQAVASGSYFVTLMLDGSTPDTRARDSRRVDSRRVVLVR